MPSVRNDKKAIKEAIKFREVVAFYDAQTFQKLLVVNDVFDIVFSMSFSPDGSRLYLFNAPNIRFRATTGASRNGYIQMVNAANGTSTRLTFATNSPEPIYKESSNNKYFAATSIEQKFRVLNTVSVFNRETGAYLKYFVNDFRLMEKTHWGRASFAFLPDGKTIALGYGIKMALWTFEE